MELLDNLDENTEYTDEKFEEVLKDIDVVLQTVEHRNKQYCIRIFVDDWASDFTIEINPITGAFVEFSITDFPFYMGEIIPHIKTVKIDDSGNVIHYIDFESMKYKIFKRYIMSIFNEDNTKSND